MGKILGGLLGTSAPKVSQQPVVDTKAAQDEAKKARVALYGTEGGVNGEVLNPGSTSSRQTLLGN